MDEDSRGTWSTGGYAQAIRAYVVEVCGPKTPDLVVGDALRRMAETAGSSELLDEERVWEAARDAALAEADRLAGRAGNRLWHILRGRFGHSEMPGLLRRRAGGLISTEELRKLYATANVCSRCGHLAARFDAAEWQLSRALGEVSAPFTDAAARPAQPSLRASEQALDEATLAEPELGLHPGGHARPARRGSRRLVPALIVGVLLAGAACDVATYLIFGGGGAGPDRSLSSAPARPPRPASLRELPRPGAVPTATSILG